MIARLVNTLWRLRARAASARMARALHDPHTAQLAILRRILTTSAGTVFGREHRFDRIDSPAAFARNVPVRTADDFAPWIDRVAWGEPRLLTAEPVLRLLPSSGSTAPRKLIPFTRSLAHEFNAAIGPWITDLFSTAPALARGRAYWSITPAPPAPPSPSEGAPVPIGFGDDSAYLGGILAPLFRRALAAPPEVARNTDMRAFRLATLLALLRCRDLPLISIWHPSYLDLLLDELEASWDLLLNQVARGGCDFPDVHPACRAALGARAATRRHAELRRASPRDLRAIWPALGLVSCWADGAASAPAHALQSRLGGIPLQPKGLLATEGVISIPLRGAHPLAVTSHFLEFVDDSGAVHLAHELQRGVPYQPLLTTGGGLYRYRLGDVVTVDAMVDNTPSIRFGGRADSVCDLVGEKLSEAFVSAALDRWLTAAGPSPDRTTLASPAGSPFTVRAAAPSFAMLAPLDDGASHERAPQSSAPTHPAASGAAGTPPTAALTRSPCYALFIEAGPRPHGRAPELDALLRENPHYDWARRLGQLGELRIIEIGSGAYARYSAALVARGMRLGDIKPSRLSSRRDWRAALTLSDAPPPGESRPEAR